MALDVNVDALRAQEILESGGARTAKSVYELTLIVTGSEEQADQARAEFIEERLRQEQDVPLG